MLNLGRARVASKGLDRAAENGHDPGAPKFVTLTPEDQAARGMYMLGQVAHLRSATVTLAELHHDVSVTGSALLALALMRGVLDEDQVWAAAHVDEDWNIAQWGVDEEVAARRLARFLDFRAAANVLKALDFRRS